MLTSWTAGSAAGDHTHVVGGRSREDEKLLRYSHFENTFISVLKSEKLGHLLTMSAVFLLRDGRRYVRMRVWFSPMEKLFQGKHSSCPLRSPPIIVQWAVSFINLEHVSKLLWTRVKSSALKCVFPSSRTTVAKYSFNSVDWNSVFNCFIIFAIDEQTAITIYIR